MNPEGMVALLNYRVRLVVLICVLHEFLINIPPVGGWCYSYVFLSSGRRRIY